jgi:hypothetical protein
MAADHGHSGDIARTERELLPQHKQGWETFTRATTYACIGVAAVLLLMLLFLYIL